MICHPIFKVSTGNTKETFNGIIVVKKANKMSSRGYTLHMQEPGKTLLCNFEYFN